MWQLLCRSTLLHVSLKKVSRRGKDKKTQLHSGQLFFPEKGKKERHTVEPYYCVCMSLSLPPPLPPYPLPSLSLWPLSLSLSTSPPPPLHTPFPLSLASLSLPLPTRSLPLLTSLSLSLVEGMKAMEIDQCKQELKQLKCLLATDQYVHVNSSPFYHCTKIKISV